MTFTLVILVVGSLYTTNKTRFKAVKTDTMIDIYPANSQNLTLPLKGEKLLTQCATRIISRKTITVSHFFKQPHNSPYALLGIRTFTSLKTQFSLFVVLQIFQWPYVLKMRPCSHIIHTQDFFRPKPAPRNIEDRSRSLLYSLIYNWSTVLIRQLTEWQKKKKKTLQVHMTNKVWENIM